MNRFRRSLVILFAFLVLATVTACKPGDKNDPSRTDRVKVNSVETSCQSSGDDGGLKLKERGSHYRLSGSLQTSNPCKKLNVDTTRNSDTLTVTLRAVSVGGACIMCVGSMDFRLKLTTGARILEVRYQGERLLRRELD